MDKRLLDILCCPVSKTPVRQLARGELEAINTAIAAGAKAATVLVRGDSAYCNGKAIAAVAKTGAMFSFAIARNPAVDAAIATIGDERYVAVHYPGAVEDPDTGQLISDAQVAEVPYTAFARSRGRTAHDVIRQAPSRRLWSGQRRLAVGASCPMPKTKSRVRRSPDWTDVGVVSRSGRRRSAGLLAPDEEKDRQARGVAALVIVRPLQRCGGLAYLGGWQAVPDQRVEIGRHHPVVGADLPSQRGRLAVGDPEALVLVAPGVRPGAGNRCATGEARVQDREDERAAGAYGPGMRKHGRPDRATPSIWPHGSARGRDATISAARL